MHFNPRPPRGGRLKLDTDKPISQVFQSTPPARGATVGTHFIRPIKGISIHAPREGGDDRAAVLCGRQLHFNPRPPRGGRLFAPVVAYRRNAISIHAPREGGDTASRGRCSRSGNFNPRPPRGGRLMDVDGGV